VAGPWAGKAANAAASPHLPEDARPGQAGVMALDSALLQLGAIWSAEDQRDAMLKAAQQQQAKPPQRRGSLPAPRQDHQIGVLVGEPAIGAVTPRAAAASSSATIDGMVKWAPAGSRLWIGHQRVVLLAVRTRLSVLASSESRKSSAKTLCMGPR